MKKIEIVVQHFPTCPNGPKMIRNILEAIRGFDEMIEYREIIINDEQTVKKLKFRGSPTLLINGLDFEDVPELEDPALSCRFYPTGVPSSEEIKRKILEITNL